MMSRASATACLIALTLLFTGCGLFERREVAYQESQSHPPLQVPADLDRPQMDDALHIPDLPAPGSRRSDINVVDGASSGSQLGVGTLYIADTPASSWRRAGLALARIPEVSVVESDESAGRYRIEATATRPVKGFFRRMLKREERVVESFDLFFEAEGAGTRIRSEGGRDVAQALLKRLQERLG